MKNSQKKLYVNLAVTNLEKTRTFFKALGFTFNETFSDDKALAMNINSHAGVMLLKKTFFKSFIKTELVNAKKSTETLLALELPTRKAVDQMADKALTLGGKIAYAPRDYGFMYSRGIHDLDGHIWEIYWMDEKKFPKPEKTKNNSNSTKAKKS